MNEVELMHFYDVAGDWVVDDACYDFLLILLVICFKSTLIAVELIAMTTYIMFAI